MQSPEERLAKITGQPVAEVVADVQAGAQVQHTGGGHTEDPPLEMLTRDPQPEVDLLSGLLGAGGAGGGGGGGGGAPQQNPVRFSQAVWFFLALAVRLLLETEYKVYIMESGVLPFLLLLPVMMVTGHLHLPSLRSASLLTAALMLCGVDQAKVAALTRTLHLGSILVHCLSVYLFSFLLSHILIIYVVDTLVLYQFSASEAV